LLLLSSPLDIVDPFAAVVNETHARNLRGNVIHSRAPEPASVSRHLSHVAQTKGHDSSGESSTPITYALGVKRKQSEWRQTRSSRFAMAAGENDFRFFEGALAAGIRATDMQIVGITIQERAQRTRCDDH
jgi:hypothetical protein